MNISSKSQYALLTVFDLASQKTGRPVKIASIAKRQDIPRKFLELILLSLKQGGFVESHRGAEGGYTLARRPEHITVAEVLHFVDGGAPNRRRSSGETPFTDLWQEVDRSVTAILAVKDFASIIRAWEEKQSVFVHDWEI